MEGRSHAHLKASIPTAHTCFEREIRYLSDNKRIGWKCKEDNSFRKAYVEVKFEERSESGTKSRDFQRNQNSKGFRQEMALVDETTMEDQVEMV